MTTIAGPLSLSPTAVALARSRNVELTRLARALRVLQERGLVAAGPTHEPTSAGHVVLDRLVAARTAWLRELLVCWAPERHAELAEFVRRLAADDLGDRAPA